jgi:hypothetical protein
MNTHNFNELTQTLQSLIIASENEGMYKLDVKFHPDGETMAGSQCQTKSEIERYNLKTSGYFNVVFYNQLNGSNFTMGHIFRLNFEVLKNKIDIARSFGYFPFDELDTIEVKNSIAKQIEINYNEFKVNLACYNGKLDNYEGIAKFIIKHNAEIMFRVNPRFEFGLYLPEEKNKHTYSLNYKLEWYEDYCIKSGLNSVNDYLLNELKKRYDLENDWHYGVNDISEAAFNTKIDVFEKAMLNLFFNSDMLVKSYRKFGREELFFHKELKVAYSFESQIQKSFWFNEVNPALFNNKGYKHIPNEIEKCIKDVFKFSEKTKVNYLLLIELCVNLKFLKDEESILYFLKSILRPLYYIKNGDKTFDSKLELLSIKLNDLRQKYELIKFIVPANDTVKLDKEFDKKMDEFLVEIGVWRNLEDDDKEALFSDREWDTYWRLFLWKVRYLNNEDDVNHLYESYFNDCIWSLWTKSDNSISIFKNLNKWKRIVPPAL